MDIGVVPHSNEYRSPIKLFEYMGQGKAVVAPRTEPIEMVVNDGVNGLLFDSASKEVDSALAELDRREIEQRAALRRNPALDRQRFQHVR